MNLSNTKASNWTAAEREALERALSMLTSRTRFKEAIASVANSSKRVRDSLDSRISFIRRSLKSQDRRAK